MFDFAIDSSAAGSECARMAARTSPAHSSSVAPPTTQATTRRSFWRRTCRAGWNGLGAMASGLDSRESLAAVGRGEKLFMGYSRVVPFEANER